MSRQRSRLSIGELLVMIAVVAVTLGVWRTYDQFWQREEEILLAAWLGAWMVGVLGSRMFGWSAILPAAFLCTAAVVAADIYFRLPWQSQACLAGGGLVLALVTAPLPQLIVAVGSRIARGVAASPSRRRAAAGLAAASVVAGLAWWQPWRPPAVVVQRLEQFADPLDPFLRRLHLLAVSPEGKLLAVYEDRQVTLLDATSGRKRTIPIASPIVPLCCFSRDGRLLALLVDGEPIRAVVYESSSLEEAAAIELLERPRTCTFLEERRLCLGFAPDFQHVRFEEWEVQPRVTKRRQWSFDSGPGAVTGPYAIDGSLILVHPRGAVDDRRPWQLWRVEPAEKIADLDPELNPNYVAGAMPLHVVGTWCGCGNECWDVETGRAYAMETKLAGVRPAAEQLAFATLLLDPRSPSMPVSMYLRGPAQMQSFWKRLLAYQPAPPEVPWMLQTPFWRVRYIPEVGIRLRLWNVRDPGMWESRVESFTPDWRGSLELAASADGDAIAAMDSNARVILWRLSGRRGLASTRPGSEFELGGE